MADSTLILEPMPVNLKTCQPSLMPFHISYSGPAAIQTYMDIKPAKEAAKEPLKAPEGDQNGVQGGAEARGTEATGEAMSVDNGPEATKSLKESAQGEGENQPKDCSSALSDSADQQNGSIHSQAPPSETLPTTRSVSTFRGRTIQGLKVDLPEGYRGLVLLAPATSTSSGSLKTKPSQPQPNQIEQASTSTRRKGRLTRSAVSTKIIDIEKEEARKAKASAIDIDALMEVDGDEAEQADNTPQRRLKAVSQFSSFTLWHADHPVVENHDEYYRSVHEWTALASALHQADDEDDKHY